MLLAQNSVPPEMVWIAAASAFISFASACFAGLTYRHARTSYVRRGRSVEVFVDLVETATSESIDHELRVTILNNGEHEIYVEYWLFEFREFTRRHGIESRRVGVRLDGNDLQGPALPQSLKGFHTLTWTSPWVAWQNPVWIRVLVMTGTGPFKSRWLRVASARRPYFTVVSSPSGKAHHIPPDYRPKSRIRRQRREL
jgi:hypothetical protein